MSKDRAVVLFNNFTSGLKYLGVSVSEEEAAAEQQWLTEEKRIRLRAGLERLKRRYLIDLEAAEGQDVDMEPPGGQEG